MSQSDFEDDGQFVLELRSEDVFAGALVRCNWAGLADFDACLGKTVLLHGPRDALRKGYYGQAVIVDYHSLPDGRRTLIEIGWAEFFAESVSTARNGAPREDASFGSSGQAPFSFFATGLRRISLDRYNDILVAAGKGPVPPGGHLFERTTGWPGAQRAEALWNPDLMDTAWTMEARRSRAYHRSKLIEIYGAFCCMSGASRDVPGGPSLLQVSHYWPLGRGGPDRLTNVGLVMPNVHCIYENGLMTVRSDYSYRFAPDIPPGFRAEFRGHRRLLLSGNSSFDPAEDNLAYHQKEIFERRLRQQGLPLWDRRED